MGKHYKLIFALFLISSCATYKTKYGELARTTDLPNKKEVVHTFYLIGDAGLSPIGDMNPVLKKFKTRLAAAAENSTVIFLGDNIYPAGFQDPESNPEGYRAAKSHLDAQLNTLTDFKGKTMFIPGNHDWYAKGLKGLERQQKYIEKALDSKKVFFPEDGCPMKKVEISDDIVVLAIDTQWFLVNWDRHPTINDECDIRDREKFFEELEGEIKKNADKTTILALHHPIFTYGVHGGHYSFKKQLIPVLGTLINVLRNTTGVSTTDIYNKRYNELRKRVVTLAQYSEKVIFASGHEHTLQYIVEDNTPQIVSGSGAKEGATKLLNGSQFSTGKTGYATLEVYADGSSRVRYYGVDEDKEEFLFTAEVLPADPVAPETTGSNSFPAEKMASIYSREEVTKSNFFKSIWGERYRDLYAVEVKAPTVDLDTLFGGLKVIRKGGGHQSKSLRLENKEGKQYVMRALRKSAEAYLQAMAFKDQYIIGEFEGTYTEGLLLDFYTGAHPYAPFTVATLADAVGIYHTNPTLYYIPKQNAIRGYEEEFGDGLYMIEERTTDGHGDQASFGYANKMESTDDLLSRLRKDEKFSIDKEAYIKARLFDILLGDWDRHTDQWRWAEFKDEESGDVIYRPVPRDRDQVFSIMGDGSLMKLATKIIPSLGIFEGFNEEIRSVKGFTSSPKTFALDMALLPETTPEMWEEQARFLQDNLSPEIIDEALLSIPEEARDAVISARIKKVLLARKANLLETAKEYYDILNKFSVVVGTDKDDHFMITGLADGKTEVKGYRIKGGKKADLFFDKVYDRTITKEIWIYGLDDDDVFEVRGVKGGVKKIRIVGGQNNDIYDVSDSRAVYLYDNRAKKNTFKNTQGARKRLSTDYETNTYRPILIKNSTNQLIPFIGGNPDDGLNLGITNTYTYNGFKQNPFTSQHTFNAGFYFATTGFDLGYKGEFARVFGKANLELAAKFTSPNFSINFFGFGNETENFDDDLEFDFNRVKIRTIKASPSLVWRGEFGSKFRTGVSYETIEVEETEGRFIEDFFTSTGIDNENSFFGVDAEYSYANNDNEAFPTIGMATALHVGYKTSTENSDQGFGFIIPSLSFDYKLVPSGRLVLATKWKAHFNLGDDFEFYQAASIGGFDGLRGFRNQRFTGKTSYYQNTDLRLSLREVKTGLLPLSVGIYGGFDYGRVWLPDEDSGQWHNSVGGGFFLNGADITSISLALFSSDDGLRFTFGLGFGF